MPVYGPRKRRNEISLIQILIPQVSVVGISGCNLVCVFPWYMLLDIGYVGAVWPEYL